MADGRKHLRATPPSQVIGQPLVTAYLSPEQYRKLYDLAAVQGVSLAEALRRLIDGYTK